MIFLTAFTLAVFSCSFIEKIVAFQDDPLVNIDQGILRGQLLTTETGFAYYSFKGIPYARPPVGNFRFKPPQAPLPWEGVRNATDLGSMCLQIGDVLPVVTGDEDCLYLNVYTPKLPSNDVKPNISVMVFIHGGAFITGSGSNSTSGPDYLVEQQVVLVTINYRLGALGFLGLNHTDFSKNNGLKDQVAALKWVKNNIEKFGGNPESVTIYGESAGAFSVHYHMLAPAAKGLFQRAISESGSSLDAEAFITPEIAHQRAFALGTILGYNDTDPAGLAEFLNHVDARTIVQNQGEAFAEEDIEHGSHARIYLPTVEYGNDIYLPDYPVNILKSGNFYQVPYITGVNSKEGKMFAADYLSPSQLSLIDEHLEWFLPRDLDYKLGSKESLTATEKIRTTYFGNSSISEDTIEGLVDFLGDVHVVTGVHRAIKHLLRVGTAPLYFYVFSYTGKLSISEILYDYDFPGAGHTDELMYIFKAPITVDGNSTEMETVRRMTKMWTNFAKSQDPSSGLDITWSPLAGNTYTYLNIDNELTIKDFNKFEEEEMNLWDSLYEKIDRK